MGVNIISGNGYSLTTPVSAAPFTVAIWYKVPATGVQYELMRIAGGGDLALLSLRSSGNLWLYNQAGSSQALDDEGTYSANVWEHACGVLTSNSNREVYLNGVSTGNNTDSIGITTLTTMTIAQATNLKIAEVAVWNAALTAAEVAQLSKGVCARFIRPASMVLYSPLIVSGSDPYGLVAMTEVGSTPSAASDHPPIVGAIAA